MERLAGRIILLWGWRRALVAFAAGALAVLAQAPYDFFAACFVSFPVLVWLLDGAAVAAPAGLLRRLAPAFATGWWFGFGYFLVGLWWIGSALLVEADSFAWALPLAVIGVPMVLALFYGLAASIARLFWSDTVGRIAALAFGFGIAEWLRTVLFTGFPWNAIGYAAMPTPLLMQSVSVVGLIGMNALAIFVFAMPGLLAARRNLRIGIAAAIVLGGTHAGYGYYRITRPEPLATRSLAVRIVQPSVDMSEKFDAAAEDRIFASLMEASSAAPAQGVQKPQLIVWPETSVPFLLTDRPDALNAIGALLADDQMLVAGAVRSEGASRADEIYYNSVVAIDAAGQIADAVDKVHLVPFGEYIPFADLFDRIGIGQLVAGPMTFQAGTQRHAITLPGGIRAVPFICYEIIFPDLVSTDAAAANIIINVTNDGWFGNTPGPYQHFRQAQVRAVETGLPLVRAANTGISGLIDARGRVIDALALDARGAIDAVVTIAPRPAALPVSPRIAGYGVLLFFGLLAFAMKLRHRFRPI